MRSAKPASILSRYSSPFCLGALLAATLLSVAPARAAVYTESGDAGDLPATAQVISGAANTSLTAIKGTLTKTAGISEADMFQIYISSPTTFSATTTGFSPGVNNFDTQLFLFTVGGIGILGNDDDANSGGSGSTLPAGSFTLGAGVYDLLITGYGRGPASTGGLIFPDYTDFLNVDPNGVDGPTGPGGASPLSKYLGNSNDGGAYSIALTGAQFVTAAATVPEPSTIVIFGSGLALLFFVRRRRSTLSFFDASVSPL